jgi:hypothetical protein
MDLRRRIYLDVKSLVQHEGSRLLVLRAGQARSATCRIDAAVYYREYEAYVWVLKSCSDSLNHNCYGFPNHKMNLEEILLTSTFHEDENTGLPDPLHQLHKFPN